MTTQPETALISKGEVVVEEAFLDELREEAAEMLDVATELAHRLPRTPANRPIVDRARAMLAKHGVVIP